MSTPITSIPVEVEVEIHHVHEDLPYVPRPLKGLLLGILGFTLGVCFGVACLLFLGLWVAAAVLALIWTTAAVAAIILIDIFDRKDEKLQSLVNHHTRQQLDAPPKAIARD